MTFDEVLDEMNANQEPSESIRFMEQLRDIYAPTVEMTKEQYHSFKLWKYHTAGWNMTNCSEVNKLDYFYSVNQATFEIRLRL